MFFTRMANCTSWVITPESNWEIGRPMRTTWVAPRDDAASGPAMKNIRWISAMEHDWKYPAVNAINENMHLYNWGAEQGHCLGRGNKNLMPVDPGMQLGFRLLIKFFP